MLIFEFWPNFKTQNWTEPQNFVNQNYILKLNGYKKIQAQKPNGFERLSNLKTVNLWKPRFFFPHKKYAPLVLKLT